NFDKRAFVEAAEIRDIVLGCEVVDETGVDGLPRVHVSRSYREEVGREVSLVEDRPSAVVRHVRRRHDGGFDRGRRPIGVRFLDQGGDAGEVRAGHGGAG
ncbi:unnamed protein product, partial [Musa acuminata subsp. burmannicoides]